MRHLWKCGLLVLVLGAVVCLGSGDAQAHHPYGYGSYYAPRGYGYAAPYRAYGSRAWSYGPAYGGVPRYAAPRPYGYGYGYGYSGYGAGYGSGYGGGYRGYCR